MAHKDWMPSREQDLVDLQNKWLDGLASPVYKSQFGWNEAEITAASTAITKFHGARNAYANDNSTGNRISKDEAKVVSVDAMRTFANTSIRFNQKMSGEYKNIFGVDEKDMTYTSHEAPKEQPSLQVENTRVRFQHQLRALNQETGATGKPADAYGVRYSWQVSAAPGERPAKGEDLPKTKFSRKTTITITHTEAEKGKAVYYAACYENAKGESGPWSLIEEAIIG
jgi:hypothetical protein